MRYQPFLFCLFLEVLGVLTGLGPDVVLCTLCKSWFPQRVRPFKSGFDLTLVQRREFQGDTRQLPNSQQRTTFIDGGGTVHLTFSRNHRRTWSIDGFSMRGPRGLRYEL